MSQGHDWWENLGEYRDEEIERIDALESALGELAENVRKLRHLITSLELCHHKAKRRVGNLIQAIGAGHTDKGPRYPKGQPLRPEQVRWKALADVLDMWVTQIPLDDALDEKPHYAADVRLLYRHLGGYSPLRAWQVEHVRLRILDHLSPLVHYPYIERDEPDSDFKRQTDAQRLVTHGPPGAETDFSLSMAIDNTVPCNWNFETNLRLVLSAIGGNGALDGLWAAHGCNLRFHPLRDEMAGVATALADHAASRSPGAPIAWVGEALGDPSPLRKWLAASLSKTIRVQMSID